MLGKILIILGVLYFLKNIGVITGSVWGILWPILIILLGLYLIKGKYYFDRFFWQEYWWKKKDKNKNDDW